MKNHIAKLSKNVVVFMVAAVAFMTTSAIPGIAQQQGNPVYVPPVMERREADMANQRETRQRETLRESLGKRPGKSGDPRYVQAVLAQVKEDFERIQVVRNGIVRAASAANALDYKFISDAAAEIKKRASRLKSNLALPDHEGDEKVEKNQGEFNKEHMEDALLILCNRIESFVKNPFFETPRVVDIELLTKASSDLKSMVELSGRISKSADRLNKSSK
jgi:hypothetical protein